MDTKSKIILISGPTASGKSNFAIKLAKKIDGEIINADSMQIYKQLKKIQPDIIIVMAYGLLLPSKFLSLPKLGCKYTLGLS